MSDDQLRREMDLSMSYVHQVLTDLAICTLGLHATGRFGRHDLDEMSRQLEVIAADALSSGHSEIVGVGVVWETGTEPNSDSGMLWWRADYGELARKVHVYNPNSDTYYDYRNSEWYLRAGSTDALVIAGPYIDAWGTDDHALTPSVAIMSSAGDLIGVAAADLDVTRTTDHWARTLEPFGDVVLVNGDGQVVAANHPLLSPGLRLDPFLAQMNLAVVDRIPLAIDGWHVARLGPR